MRLLSFFLFVMLLQIMNSQPSDFLSKLRSEDYYNRATLIDHLAHLKTWNSDEEMELNILIDFIKRQVSNENIDYDFIKYKIRQTFDRFKQQWIETMITNSMKAIGLDSSNIELKKRIIANPKAYSIDYQTYKIITYKNEKETTI